MDLYSVCIIFSASLNKYYVGYSVNVDNRIIDHNSGISTFTSKASDWELKWKKEFNTREEAKNEEKRIKSKKSRKFIEWLINSVG